MPLSTKDDQWRGLASNLGTWEGNLSRYDPDGNLKTRQGSVLFIYVDSHEDKQRIENGNPPSVIKLRLHRCKDQSDVTELYLQDTYPTSGRGVYNPLNGDLNSGTRVLNPLSRVGVELALNARDELGIIFARARLITIFNAERLQSFSVFRERSSSLSYDTLLPEVPSSIADSDLVATKAEATLEKLCGTWSGHLTRLRPRGAEIETSTERYTSRTSVQGNEVRIEGPLGGSGTASEDRKTVLFVDRERIWRLVFLGGGVTAMTSLTVPSAGEDFFSEFSWLVRDDMRKRSWRRYVGENWVESCFAEEIKESGTE